MKKILIIDDEIEMLEGLEKIFSHRNEFEVTFIDNSLIGNELVKTKRFDLILTDLKMKEFSGLDILKTALKNFPDALVIMISGYGTIEASVEAMREGAFDFLEKPFTSQKLFNCIDRAFKIKSDRSDEQKVSEKKNKSFHGIIYKSNEIDDILEMAKKIAPGDMNVLITGESGTGKELVARAIHNLSKSNSYPFVPVNCGALPESLFESELFGHERGAFTGAVKTKPGLLEFAQDGTFFFDEVGELSPSLQVKLLRMLEDKKIRRVGGQNEIDINVRIITASNRNLEQAVKEKSFREDLYYRLSTIQIEVPPLRERADDIMPLAHHFLHEICSKEDVNGIKFSIEAEELLKSYSWPGNVRELQNIIGRTYYLCSDKIVQAKDLPLPISSESHGINLEFLNMNYKNAKEQILEKFEVEYLTHHLKKNNGNISHTAELCGMDRRTIHRFIKEYNIIYKDENIESGNH
jgi:DNA-binding NtrC family response regulator